MNIKEKEKKQLQQQIVDTASDYSVRSHIQ